MLITNIIGTLRKYHFKEKSVTRIVLNLFYPTLIIFALALGSCSNDEGEVCCDGTVVQDIPKMVLMPSINGMGDNGYNDAILDGLFMFHEATGTAFNVLHPSNMEEAERMYNQWLVENTYADSCVLVIASSAYEEMVSSTPVNLQGKNSRILLLESTSEIKGVSTLSINRYGASYMAGALVGRYPAYILAAVPGMPMLETAIQGFKDGHDAHVGRYPNVRVEYLAKDKQGFAMPDSAYHVMARHIETITTKDTTLLELFYSEAVFPLLGGSYAGALQAIDDSRFSVGVMIGIDRDRKNQSVNIPFSMTVNVDTILANYLLQWIRGEAWPATQTMGLEDHGTNIVFNMQYKPKSSVRIRDFEIMDIKQLSSQYNDLKSEAIRKEAEYESKL